MDAVVHLTTSPARPHSPSGAGAPTNADRRRFGGWWRLAFIIVISTTLLVPEYVYELRSVADGAAPVAAFALPAVLDVGLGVVALCLYLRRGDAKPALGFVVIALGTLSTVAAVTGFFALVTIAARRRIGPTALAGALTVVVAVLARFLDSAMTAALLPGG